MKILFGWKLKHLQENSKQSPATLFKILRWTSTVNHFVNDSLLFSHHIRSRWNYILARVRHKSPCPLQKVAFAFLWCLKINPVIRLVWYTMYDLSVGNPIGQIIWLIRKHFLEGLHLISTSLKQQSRSQQPSIQPVSSTRYQIRDCARGKDVKIKVPRLRSKYTRIPAVDYQYQSEIKFVSAEPGIWVGQKHQGGPLFS